jgi:hypothetical protein
LNIPGFSEVKNGQPILEMKEMEFSIYFAESTELKRLTEKWRKKTFQELKHSLCRPLSGF